jgi:hypothetical protein
MPTISGMMPMSHPLRFGIIQPRQHQPLGIKSAEDLAQALKNNTNFSIKTLIQGLNQWVKTPQDARKVLIAHQDSINRSAQSTWAASQKGYFGTGGLVYDYNFAILNRLSYALGIIHSHSGIDGNPRLSEPVNQLLLKAFTGLAQEVSRDYIARVQRTFGGPYKEKHIIEPGDRYIWA